MTFYDSFRDELRKIGEEAGLVPLLEEDQDPGSNVVETPQDGGVEQPAVAEGQEGSEPLKDAVPAPPVGDLASTGARTALQGMLKTEQGKRAIRETFNKLDRKAEEVASLKKAFTRGLLRARREVYGPAHDPVQNLNEILEGNTFAPQPA